MTDQPETDATALEAVPDPETVGPEPEGAPVMPWDITLRSCVRHFSRGPNGGIRLHFTVAQPIREGYAMSPPQIVILFSADAWAEFQREVANNGVKPRIQTAQVIPTPRGPVH